MLRADEDGPFSPVSHPGRKCREEGGKRWCRVDRYTAPVDGPGPGPHVGPVCVRRRGDGRGRSRKGGREEAPQAPRTLPDDR